METEHSMEIEIRNLSYQAGGRQILHNVSSVFRGPGICGIIGPNGCGKTTLLRHIYRELNGAGHVFLNGKDVHAFSGRVFSRHMAVMMQHQNIVEKDLRVRDIVCMGRYPYKNLVGRYNLEDQKIVDEILAKTGLEPFQNRRVDSLSGGEMQRVMIAKCFAQQPDIIVLDEPANHLDVRYKVELMKMLRDFPGLVIMTLHDLNLAAEYCTRLYLMDQGIILLEGGAQEVLQEEMLQKVFQTPIRVFHTPYGTFTSV